MTERAIEIAASLCRKFEGLHLKPYICPAGIPTIGYGSTHYEGGIKVSLKDAPINEQYALRLLYMDLDAAYRSALKASPNLINYPDKHAAIIDFIYNLGAGRYFSSTLRKKVNDENWQEAVEQINKWVFGGGKKLRGLVLRRAEEASLLLA